MNIRACLVCVGMLGAASAVLAQQPGAPLEAGYWEIVSVPDFKGIPIVPTPKTLRHCVSEADATQVRIPLASLPDCRVSGGRWEGNKAELAFQCEGLAPGVSMKGELNAAGRSFAGTIELVQAPQADAPAAPVSIKYQHRGRWLGSACPPATP